jgi:DNA polymerase IV
MRSIIHVDMDAFYAAIEQRDRPETRGLPVIIAHVGARGVVSTASYEARKFGVRSAMPTAQAQKLCPNGIYIEPNLAHYSAVSKQVFEVFARYTPIIEGLSLDEAFLDVSQSLALFGSAEDIGKRIRAEVFYVTKLTCSVGLSHNKLLAKMASELCKPNGFLWLKTDAVHATLDPLPVGRLYTIGKVAQAELEKIGVRTIGDLRLAKAALVQKALGNHTRTAQAFAAGLDEREVENERLDKSIGAEHTFNEDLVDWPAVQMWLMRLCERVAARLRQQQLKAGTLTVKLRVPPFETSTRQCTMTASAATDVLFHHASKLTKKWWQEQQSPRLRLLGISASHFNDSAETEPNAQLALFAEDAKTDTQASKRDALRDQISARFGDKAVKRARTIQSLPGKK